MNVFQGIAIQQDEIGDPERVRGKPERLDSNFRLADHPRIVSRSLEQTFGEFTST
jgi:hypothetical protein